MGNMIANGLTVQIQKRADQEAYLKAFWEFHESVTYQFEHNEFASLGHNTFQQNLPCFDNCQCSCPTRFYPEEEIMRQLDPQCLMRDREIITLWKNLHHSMDTVWKMLTHFDRQRNENLSSFRLQFLKYNEHGAVDLLSWRPENRLFILYTIIYLTFYPDAEGELGILEAFETQESFKEYLEELSMAQFVKLSPLLRIFMRIHSFGDRRTYFDPENDLENMIDYFFKRAYYQQISETRFNVYTAAIVYGNSMLLSNFGEKRRRELEQMEKRKERSRPKRPNTIMAKITNRRAKQVVQSIETVANKAQQVDDLMYGNQEEQLFVEDYTDNKSGSGKKPDEQIKEDYHSKAEAHAIRRTSRDEEGTKTNGMKRSSRNVETTSWFGKCFNKISQYQEVKDRYISDYRCSIDKSLSCMVLQLAMYIGLIMLNPENADWGDGTEDTPIKVRHFVNCAIILFTFEYVVTMSITAFYIHTVSVLIESKSITAKFLIFVNFLVNTVMACTMIFSTAVVLKRSSATLMDIVLNSTAIYFIADLDDMMISSTDEEILDERVLFTYIYHLIKLSGKTDKGVICQYLKEERWWLIFQTYATYILLVYSYYTYFGTKFPRLFKY